MASNLATFWEFAKNCLSKQLLFFLSFFFFFAYNFTIYFGSFSFSTHKCVWDGIGQIFFFFFFNFCIYVNIFQLFVYNFFPFFSDCCPIFKQKHHNLDIVLRASAFKSKNGFDFESQLQVNLFIWFNNVHQFKSSSKTVGLRLVNSNW